MPRRILIAEDEALIALELERRLTVMGYVVDVVVTGEAAIERAVQTAPDVLLFDIRLAGSIDGVEAARRIQAERPTPVVFLTAFDDEETLERARRVPLSSYLLKPFDARFLQITLDAVVFRYEAERAQAREERRRRALEHRLAVMLDQSRDAIISVDTDLRIVVFNRGASEIFGWAPHQALGLSIETLLPHDERATRRIHFERVLRGDAPEGVGASTKMRCVRRSGSVFSAEVSVARVEVDAETILTFILRDVTEREKLEQHFVETQKLDAVGRFAAGVAHDFQTLLSTIQAHAYIASQGIEGPQREPLDAIAETVERGAALARSLMAVARQGRVSDAQPLDVALELHAMARLLRAVAHGSIELELALQVDAGVAELGPAELEQIMLNLVSNARDAMPGGGRLRVAVSPVQLEHTSVLTTATVPPGRYVEVKVEDSGRGIDALTLARVFEPFFTTKPAGRGTGLGLTTVRAIVHARGGAFDLRSSGRGTIARVLIPSVDAEARAPTNHAAPARRSTLALLHRCPTTRPALLRYLRYAGVAVLDAADVEQTRRLLDGARVDGVVYAPEHDDSLGAWLREAHPGLPTLQIEPRLDAIRDVDGVALRVRPIYLADLDAVVQRLLGGRA